jgi:hypothetical protein
MALAHSSVFDPDTIAVGSSGALMGMYAAKLSQVMSRTFFDVHKIQETMLFDSINCPVPCVA